MPKTKSMPAVALMAIGIALLLLALLKINMAHRIYDKSMQIESLYRELGVLRTQHRLLQEKIEALIYKHRVIDATRVEMAGVSE